MVNASVTVTYFVVGSRPDCVVDILFRFSDRFGQCETERQKRSDG